MLWLRKILQNKQNKTMQQAQKNFQKFTKAELKNQQQTAQLIAQNNSQMAEIQGRLQNAISMQSASGATGFMGDGTSNINGMTAELESLGASVSNLQQTNTQSTQRTTKQYKTMTKTSKNIKKLNTKYNKVTTSAIARTNKSMAATAAGTTKAQKITMTGGIMTAVGAGLTATGAALLAAPDPTGSTKALGMTLTISGAAITVAGGTMTTIGTKGQDSGAAAAASLTQAGAALGGALGSTTKTGQTVKKFDQEATKNVKPVENLNKANNEAVINLQTNKDQLQQQAQNVEANNSKKSAGGPGGGLTAGNNSVAGGNQQVAGNTGMTGSPGGGITGGITAGANNSIGGAGQQTGGISGMSNPIGAPKANFASSNKAAMANFKDTMGSFGKTESQGNNIQNLSSGSTFAAGDDKKKLQMGEVAA